MMQLTLLSALGWPIWYFLYSDAPTQVNAIALGFFCSAFTGLLTLHLIVKAGRMAKARQLRNLRREPNKQGAQAH